MISHKNRIILAGTLGNMIESFDMAICGLLSAYLAKYLIGDADKGLLIIFLTFFAGYLARPIGAIVIGLLSDIYGRKKILAASILAMGIATALISFIPPYTLIGVTSACLLLTLRVIQSFACGAEYLNASAYLVENAENNNKGYAGSWASFGAMAGMMGASIVALMVSYFTKQYQNLDWLIWRIPFILALLGSSIGLYIRLYVPESMEYIMFYAKKPKPSFGELCKISLSYIKNNKLRSGYTFLLSSLGVTTTFQIYIYAPIQAHLSGNFTDQGVMLSSIISLSVLLCLFPLIGKLSDRINREKIVTAAILGFLILSQPFFYLLSNGKLYQLIMIQACIAVPAAAYYATVPVMLTELFPVNLRCTVLSMLYSIAASLSAGLAPLVSLILVKKTGYVSSPSFLVFALSIPIFVILCLKYSRRNIAITD